MIEQDTAPTLDAEWYFVLAQDEDEDEDDDKFSHIYYYTDIELDWSCGEENCTFFNQEEGLDELFKALCVWKPWEKKDWSVELKTLFEEEGEEDVKGT